jgi:hypothetical protein
MELAYTLGGGAPVVKSFVASATLSTAGIPLIGAIAAGTDNLGGIKAYADASPPTGGFRQVGISVSTTGTIAATGMTSNAAVFVKAIVNPDAVYRAKLSGGTAADTALATIFPTSGDATGAVLTGATTLDDSVVWGYSGSNAGIFRRATDTAGAIGLNFPFAVVANDLFIAANGFMGACGVTTNAFFNLTTNLTQINAQTTDSDNDNFIIVDWELRDQSDAGTTNSFYHIIPNNHAFGGNLQLT